MIRLSGLNRYYCIGEWEALYNPDFNYTEFGIIKNEAGSNNFVLSVKNWIENTKAVGLMAKAGRYGGTYEHKDIAFLIHTDAIKERLIPPKINNKQISIIYANEADVLNIALFGKTAKQWRKENPKEKGNIRDVASIQQLVVLSNLESINAMLIHQNLSQKERLIKLNTMAISQMKSLITNTTLKNIK